MTVTDKIEAMILAHPADQFHSGQIVKRLKCHPSVASKALANLADRGRIVIARQDQIPTGGAKRYYYQAPKPILLDIYWRHPKQPPTTQGETACLNHPAAAPQATPTT